MRRRDKAKLIAKQLDALYPDPAIPLNHSDPFTLLVAVVLSAQCTDVRVNQVTPELFALASTPAQMAALDPEAIRAIIRPCGLSPTKSKNLKRLSELLVERHEGAVPRTLEELEALPGVGHKTASVVQIQAFETPAFPVDTHIYRLARRWGLSTARNVTGVERDLKRLFPKRSWGLLHLQIILFGREHCPARGHDPAACPICGWAAPGIRSGTPGSSGRPGGVA